MADGKYFATTKKGEIHEFKEELRSIDRGKKKETVKKVIAAMTVGKDVSVLFPDVVNCMQTEDLELKKLVYLYLINYAKTQPDLAIMAVNTFVKDSQDPNPLIRALAVRTMGCIRVDKITEYLCDPLQRTLKDDDPYVRKTAAICVAKLYDINPELVEDRGFLDTLKDMLSDSNPMVVANAVAALAEIQEVSGKPVFQITHQTLFKLLRALNECTEWGQVFILDSLASYPGSDAKDAESIVERVTPRLQHANCAVVLSAVKVILKQLDIIDDDNVKKNMLKKMAPPLVTLLSAESEIQYVALRNISLIVQKYPQILAHEVKVFFCKYNDPIFVKMEKLDIMIQLANDRNIDQVLLEFKEYATEVDVDFVRRAVRAIGRCAVSLERAAERCINVLLELIQTKVNYVVQEAIIVIKDIFRRYPNRYESIIATLCENLDTLDEAEAKASMIWIIGEYAERIDNADELLEQFLETFPEESSMVQLQLVTATVKLFLKKPSARPQQMIQLVLTYATQETDNPDLRDRAYVYWRLLSTDPEAAKEVVLAEKPVIVDTSQTLEPSLLNVLLNNLALLASVYHKPPELFVTRTRLAVQRAEDLKPVVYEEETISVMPSDTTSGAAARVAPAAQPDLLGDLLDLDAAPAPTVPAVAPPGPVGNGALTDLLGGLDMGGLLATPPIAQPAPTAAAAPPLGDFGFGGLAAPAPAPAQSPLPVLLPADKGKGLTITGRLARKNRSPVYELVFHNATPQLLDGFMIQFNKNSFGFAPASQSIPLAPLSPGATQTGLVPVTLSTAMLAPGAATSLLQVAIRNTQQGVFYFNDAVYLPATFQEVCGIDASGFVGTWKSLPPANEVSSDVPVTVSDPAKLKAAMAAANLHFMAQKEVGAEVVLYAATTAAIPPAPCNILMELRYQSGIPGLKVTIRSDRPEIAALLFPALPVILA
eukprot:jgi/Botrbrau1/5496/Bobra.27_1s0033.1